jgi:hypothetical protein
MVRNRLLKMSGEHLAQVQHLMSVLVPDLVPIARFLVVVE